MTYYGRHKSSDVDSGTTGVNVSNQRAQIYDAMPEHGWIYAIGCLGGKLSGQPNLTWRGAVWDISGSSVDDRLAYTSTVTVSNVATSGSDAAEIQGTISTPIQGWSGTKYGIGWSVISGIFLHGMSAANNNPPESYDYYFHYKNNGSSIPTDPFNESSSSYEGTMTNWFVYDANVAPTTTLGTMTPSGTINTSTPNFVGDFDDANESRGDKMKQFQVQVVRQSDSLSFWDTTQSATASEQTNKQFVTTYAGTALVPSIGYKWRYRVSDQFGVWSSYSSYVNFTVNAGGSISTATGTPTGKQETQSPTPFTGVWTHASALSTNAVEVRVKQGSTVVRTSPTIAKTVANGATASVTWAETTFAALSWGASYTYEMRARDTGNLWSAWSAGRAFTTNASPTVPASLSPAGSIVTTTLPKLTCVSTDIDDTIATGLSVTCRIKDNAGTLIQTRTMVYNAGTLKWEYQTIAGVNEVQRITKGGTITGGSYTITVPANVLGGPFTTAAIQWNDTAATTQTRLEALANVGVGQVAVTGGPISSANVDITFTGSLGGTDLSQITVTSSLTGTAPTITPSTVTAGVINDIPRFQAYKWDARATDGTITTAYSPEASFTYALGPVVTVTAPADLSTIVTNTPTISFSQTVTQASYRVRIYQVNADLSQVLAYDSGSIVAAAAPGVTVNHVMPSGYLHNNTNYLLYVDSTSNLGVTGTNAGTSFSLVFPAPAGPTGYVVSTIKVGNDVQPSAVRLSWDEPSYASDLFLGSIITRRESGQDPAEALILAILPSTSQVTFVDYYPVSGKVYTYGLFFDVIQGTDEVETTIVEGDATVILEHTVINSVKDGTVRAGLRYGAPMTFDHDIEMVEVQPWGQELPHAFFGDHHQHIVKGSYELQDDRYSTGLADLSGLRALHMLKNVVCYRDQFGDRVFGTMQMSEQKGQRTSKAQVDITVREVDYAEGESAVT
jgi:hypothetical protein